MDTKSLGVQWLRPDLMAPTPGTRDDRPSDEPVGELRLQHPELKVVQTADLTSFEELREAERLARLLADQELIDTLQWHGFEGEGWRQLATALAEYGLAVVSAWLGTGAMVRKCREKNLRGVRALPDGGFDPDELDELATLVVGEALHSFREKVLKEHRWDSRRGAALKTYFIGHCCIRFVDVYRRWRSEESTSVEARKRERAYELDPAESALRQDRMRPDVAAVRSTEAGAALSAMRDPLTREMFALKSMGYKEEEIAELLEVSLSAVKSRIYAHRLAVRGVAR